MAGIDGLPGAGDSGRLPPRVAPGAPAASEAAPGYAPDAFTRVRPRTPEQALRRPADPKAVAMTAVGGVLAAAALVLFGSLFFATPLLGAATLFVAPPLGALAVPLLGLGISKLLAQREAAKVGER